MIFSLLSLALDAQKTAVYYYGDNDYLTGLELYEKEKYGAAMKVFEKVLNERGDEKLHSFRQDGIVTL